MKISDSTVVPKDILRFVTVGSVDDGKSTLMGRLLYETQSVFDDQMEAIERASHQQGHESTNLALLTDGLRSEREQGITIDVAYRYFSTARRKFIMADTPGHVQYTRNMITGASTAQLALLLVDARQGLVEQTFRHALLISLLQLRHLVVCVNKMDLVDYRQDIFDSVRDEFLSFAAKLEITDVHCIPISALTGDNIIQGSSHLPWYKGPTLLYLLENIHIAGDVNLIDARFPIQTVLRPYSDQWHDFRGYAGRIESGVFRKGDEVMAMGSGFTTKIQSIYKGFQEINEAVPSMSISMTLEDDIDLGRGDLIVKPNNQSQVAQDLEAMVCWLGSTQLNRLGKYTLQQTTRSLRCKVQDILYKMDVQTLHRIPGDFSVQKNDIARVAIRCSQPLYFDSYRKNRATGSFILVDENTHETVAAGMIL